MTRVTQIALIGDYRPDVVAHICAPRALALAAQSLDVPVSPCWVETGWLGRLGVAAALENFDAIWCVPASPYSDQAAVLSAIRFARTTGLPFLGTCGGFQHGVIEFARNELAMTEANSIEDDPDTPCAVVNLLECSLRDVASGIRLLPDSKLASIYGKLDISETYNCGYGINREFESAFGETPLRFCGHDDSPKAFELDGHKFFVGTAFQPERSALDDIVHPLISAFIRAVVE